MKFKHNDEGDRYILKRLCPCETAGWSYAWDRNDVWRICKHSGGFSFTCKHYKEGGCQSK